MLRTNYRVVLGAGLLLTAGGLSRADEVIHWNNVLLDSIRATGGPPCPIGRSVAMTQGAVYDAVNSIDRTHQPYLGFVAAPAGSSKEAAAAVAAHDVLAHTYPSRTAIFDAELATSLAAIPDGPAKTNGIAVGHAAAGECVASRVGDGSDHPGTYSGGNKPGEWRPTFPDFTQSPFNPEWGVTTPFTMSSGDQFRLLPGPLGFTSMSDLLHSSGYAAQVNEVKSIGARNSTTRTDEQTHIAFFWANDVNGTYKPPGHLCHITQIISAAHGLNLVQNARLFCLVGLAMGDAGVVAWDSKYDGTIHLWRPISAIRLADTDGNPATEADPTWEPLNPFSPPFPAWVSGHSTFAGAHAGVMAEYFGSDHESFTIDSEDPFYNALPVHGTRSYTSFSQAAIENARSRIYLGVHFTFDGTDGNAAGFALGHYIGHNFLRSLCGADFNNSGAVDSQDFFDFILAFFNNPPAADFNHDGVTNTQDFFDYLTAFFGGC